jgi:tetratricopeptide (TPR) repeat protein
MMTCKEYNNIIIQLQRDKNYYRVYEIIEEALTFYPLDTFFLKSEIFVLYKLNKIKEAREKAEGRMELFKYDVFFLKTYLNILAKENAKADLEQFIDNISSWNIKDEAFLIFFTRLVFKTFGKEKAINFLGRIISDVSKNSGLKRLYSEIETDSGKGGGFKHYKEKLGEKDPIEAIAEIEGIIILPDYADDYDLRLYLAELYKKTKRYDEAIETYKHLLGLKDHEFTRKMLGYTYYKMGDIENAVIYLKDVFVKHPDDHYLYRTLFKIFEKMADYERFEKIVNEALCENPDARYLFGLLKKAKKWQKD